MKCGAFEVWLKEEKNKVDEMRTIQKHRATKPYLQWLDYVWTLVIRWYLRKSPTAPRDPPTPKFHHYSISLFSFFFLITTLSNHSNGGFLYSFK